LVNLAAAIEMSKGIFESGVMTKGRVAGRQTLPQAKVTMNK
jgi:hypothetical protein